MRLFLLSLFMMGLVAHAGPREEALQHISAASDILNEQPAQAASLAEKAFQTLKTLESPAQKDLIACASFAARAWRMSGDSEKSRTWFQRAIALSPSGDAPILRAELGDLLMREGKLRQARTVLGTPPKTPSAQWHQTSAKLHLTTGRAELAERDIALAIAALPENELANRIALIIDAAGIALRLDQSPQRHLALAEPLLSQLPDPHPELISAFASVQAQSPELSPEEAFTILQSTQAHLDQNPEWLTSPARFSFVVSLAEAASKCGRLSDIPRILTPILSENALPNDHPLRARALFLAAQATGDRKLAEESSATALRWLHNAQANSSDVLLGLQRTVDPISPLLIPPLDLPALRDAALSGQNFALRQRLGGTPQAPSGQSVLFLIYQKNNQPHYGALILKKTLQWVDLGPAEKIHQRLTATIHTAERTLAEVEGSSLSLTGRLTQLWKSVWQPIAPHLDPTQPIAIAPTGLLHFVPWATLRQLDGQFLCQTHQNIRVLALTGHFPEHKSHPASLYFGFDEAPGTLNAQSSSFPFDAPLAELLSRLSPLPGIARELQSLTGRPLKNFSEQKVRTRLAESPPGLLHIAGHGFILESDQGHGFRAGLLLGQAHQSLPKLFSGQPVPAEQDNLLFAHEIAELDLSGTHTVILSACRGGIGLSETGGNWSSLRRSFIAAGAQQVLASQWRVRDDELPVFMQEFHRRLTNMPASQALWSLQRAWIEEKMPLSQGKSDSLRAASAGAWILEGISL